MTDKLWYADATLAVRSHSELVARHADAMREQFAAGRRESTAADVEQTPVIVRVDHGRWLFDCICGASVAAHPGWPDARCLGCGTIFTGVIWPPDHDAIEAALLQRKAPAHRNWRVGETVAELLADNARRPGDLRRTR